AGYQHHHQQAKQSKANTQTQRAYYPTTTPSLTTSLKPLYQQTIQSNTQSFKMHSNNFQQQQIFVTIPEYQPELYLQHPNSSLQSLLASETSSIGSPTSVSSDFELYGDDFYN